MERPSTSYLAFDQGMMRDPDRQKAYDLLWPVGTVLYQQPITPQDVVAFWGQEMVEGVGMRWRRVS